jgi:hypothetical protein
MLKKKLIQILSFQILNLPNLLSALFFLHCISHTANAFLISHFITRIFFMKTLIHPKSLTSEFLKNLKDLFLPSNFKAVLDEKQRPNKENKQYL